MKKQFKIMGLGVVGSGTIAISALGVVSADAKNGTVGASTIPRSVFKQERLAAASQVLHTTTDKVEAAHHDKSFSTLISQAGLTEQTYTKQLKAQLTTDLKAKGYSQDQITIALQHKQIVRLRHRAKSPNS